MGVRRICELHKHKSLEGDVHDSRQKVVGIRMSVEISVVGVDH